MSKEKNNERNGDDVDMNNKPALNMERIHTKPSKIISTGDPLRDVTPMEWPEEVLSGQKKVFIEKR